MFTITRGKGFWITFPNGWTVSVQWGFGNYCKNRSFDGEKPGPMFSCENAEIAAWDQNGTRHDFGSDEVKGYCSPAEVLEFMNMIAARE